ncbi:MAG: electron transport complex protein [Haloplasmataceae bacterium]|jgi:electron transport complex protein RnfG|nr:electron transport complex protein [Haloplasmataceae bacterium]
MKKYIQLVLILFIISAFSGLILGVVNEFTAEPIKAANAEKLSKGIKEIFPNIDPLSLNDANNTVSIVDEDYEELKEYYIIKDTAGNLLGYAVKVLAPGSYNGKLTVLVGINTEGKVVGLSYLALGETPGVGSRVEEPDFINYFLNITDTSHIAKLLIDKDIDSVSGATFSSTAVKNSVQSALDYFNANLKNK